MPPPPLPSPPPFPSPPLPPPPPPRRPVEEHHDTEPLGSEAKGKEEIMIIG